MAFPSLLVVRNEVDPEYEYHCDALSACASEAWDANVQELRYPAGERANLDAADAVVLSGSTAGVYEADAHPWMHEQQALIRELIAREIPTLGICFGHQIVNAALGGAVESVGMSAGLVASTFEPDPLFEGLSAIVPAVHEDVVTDPGDGMEVIASTEGYRAFGTRHREAPVWTVQFHPELTETYRNRIEAEFGWTEPNGGFERVNAPLLLENFRKLVETHR